MMKNYFPEMLKKLLIGIANSKELNKFFLLMQIEYEIKINNPKKYL